MVDLGDEQTAYASPSSGCRRSSINPVAVLIFSHAIPFRWIGGTNTFACLRPKHTKPRHLGGCRGLWIPSERPGVDHLASVKVPIFAGFESRIAGVASNTHASGIIRRDPQSHHAGARHAPRARRSRSASRGHRQRRSPMRSPGSEPGHARVPSGRAGHRARG